MLFINLFSIQNNFIKAIENHEQFGIENKDIKIREKKIKRAFLLSNFSVALSTKDNLQDIFTRTEKEVELGYKSVSILSDITFWDSIHNDLKLLVLCEHGYSTNSELNTLYELIVDRSEDGRDYFFLLSEYNWDKIVKVILKCPNNAIIRFILRTDYNEEIPILSIKYINENYIEIYSPLILEHNSGYLKRLIEDDYNCYYECYMEILFFLFVLKIEFLEVEHKTMLSNDDTFTLKCVDTYAFVFMYAPNYVPVFRFFNEFNIKLVTIQEELTDTNVEKTPSENKNSFIGLECIRLKEAIQEELSIQMNIYSQDEENPQNIFGVSDNNILYANFDFAYPKTLTFDEVPIKIFMKIEKLENNDYIFTLDFSLLESLTDSSVFEDLKDSLNNIKLITNCRTKNEDEELIITSFLKSIKNNNFQLKFSISSLEKSDMANKIIYDILETKKGFFSIQVCDLENIIMEYKVDLMELGMLVLSSNRLKEHIDNLTKKASLFVNIIPITSVMGDRGRINIENVGDFQMGISSNFNLCQPTKNFISPEGSDEENDNRAFVYYQEESNAIMNDDMYEDKELHHELDSSSKDTDNKKNNSSNGKFKGILLIIFASIIGGVLVIFYIF